MCLACAEYSNRLVQRLKDLQERGQTSQEQQTRIHYHYFLDKVYRLDCKESLRLLALEDDPINQTTVDVKDRAWPVTIPTSPFHDSGMIPENPSVSLEEHEQYWGLSRRYGESDIGFDPALPNSDYTAVHVVGCRHEWIDYQGFNSLPETICKTCGKNKE